MFRYSNLIGFKYWPSHSISSELVNASHNGFIMPLHLIHFFNSPGPAPELVKVPAFVAGNAPVSTDYSVLLVLLSKKIVNDILRICVSDIFMVYCVDPK